MERREFDKLQVHHAPAPRCAVPRAAPPWPLNMVTLRRVVEKAQGLPLQEGGKGEDRGGREGGRGAGRGEEHRGERGEGGFERGVVYIFRIPGL